MENCKKLLAAIRAHGRAAVCEMLQGEENARRTLADLLYDGENVARELGHVVRKLQNTIDGARDAADLSPGEIIDLTRIAKWHTVELLAATGSTCGVVSNEGGVLVLTVRKPDGEWPEGQTPTAFIEILEGNNRYGVTST